MLRTEFNPKKETRISLWKSVTEIDVPVGEVWRIPDKDPFDLIDEIINECDDLFDDDRNKLKRITFIKADKTLEAFVNKWDDVFDLNNNKIGRIQGYRTTKKITRRDMIGNEYEDFKYGTYLQDLDFNIYQANRTTLHEIEEIYLKNTKLVYRFATISASPIINGCVQNIKKRTYVTMDFSKNAFYITEYLNNKKTIKRVPLHWITPPDDIPEDIVYNTTIRKILENMTGVKDFDFSYDKAIEYYKNYYKTKNINFPDFEWDSSDKRYNIINKTIRKTLSWKNPVKHIIQKTKNYGKKIRKIIFENPWKLEMLDILKKYTNNLDVIQKYMTHEKSADIYISIKEYDYTLSNIDDNINTKVKNMIFMKMLEYITTEKSFKFYHTYTLWDTLTHIALIAKTAKHKHIDMNLVNNKLSKAISGTLNETDANLSKLLYELKNEKTTYIYDDKTNPYNYINNTHWEMKIPKDSSELHEWGLAFHNCVSGYSDKIRNRRCNIISFWDDKKPVLCVEVEPDTKNIRQAFEPCNKYPNEDIKNEFVNNFVAVNNLNY